MSKENPYFDTNPSHQACHPDINPNHLCWLIKEIDTNIIKYKSYKF